MRRALRAAALRATVICIVGLGLTLPQAQPAPAVALDRKIFAVELDSSPEAVERGGAAYRVMCLTCHSLQVLNLEAALTAKNIEEQLDIPARDMSVITKARGRGDEGARYVYTLLTGYRHGDNVAYPGLRMPDPGVDRQMAQDIAVFLDHTADPFAAYRKTIGRYVLAFVAFLSVLLWLNYKDTWSSLKP